MDQSAQQRRVNGDRFLGADFLAAITTDAFGVIVLRNGIIIPLYLFRLCLICLCLICFGSWKG